MANCSRHRCGEGGRQVASDAFSLVELLVVLSVVGLLLAVTVPSYRAAREHAMTAMCESNLHAAAQTMHTGNPQDGLDVPDASLWAQFVSDQAGAGVLRCPKDAGEHAGPDAGDLRDLWIEHEQNGDRFYFNVYDAIYGDRSGDEFHQVDVRRSGDDVEVWIDDDAGVRLSMGSYITIESIDAPGQYGCVSDHALYKGDEKLMQLTGRNYHSVDAPVGFHAGPLSYGMNNQVPSTKPRPKQLMLLDYRKSVADVDGAGSQEDDLSETLAPRHAGRVNAARVDGSVFSAMPQGLRSQAERSDGMWSP